MTDLKKALTALKSIRSQCEDPSPDIDAIHRAADDAIYDIEEGQEPPDPEDGHHEKIMDKKKIIAYLDQLTEYFKQDSVQITSTKLRVSQGDKEGLDPETYQYKTHHPDGTKRFIIEINIYDSKADKSDEAYNPIQEMKKENLEM